MSDPCLPSSLYPQSDETIAQNHVHILVVLMKSLIGLNLQEVCLVFVWSKFRPVLQDRNLAHFGRYISNSNV